MTENGNQSGVTTESGIPPSMWLRCIFPARFRRLPHDLRMEVHQVELEETISGIAAAIVEQHGSSREDAAALAASMLMNECLALHRQHSPAGHKAMISVLFFHDPLLADVRLLFRRAASRAARRELCCGLMLGCGLGLAFGCALLLLRMAARSLG